MFTDVVAFGEAICQARGGESEGALRGCAVILMGMGAGGAGGMGSTGARAGPVLPRLIVQCSDVKAQ